MLTVHGGSSETSELNVALNQDSVDSTPASRIEQTDGLPRYIRPLPSHIGALDIEYLAKKDALAIPSDSLRSLLLRHYVQHIHPFMPVLDLEDFLTRIAHNDPSKPISLLLFQAVMFVSVIFVPVNALHEAGFTNRRVARKAFFQRVRLLYGLDCEEDRLSLLQALLLMTYWYDQPKDFKDTWHYMGISISLAQILGIHRDPEHLKISPQAKRMQRRIWWSCYIRDRLLALGIRRPARIRQQDFNVPMLTPEDFDIPSIPLDILRSACDWPALQDAHFHGTMATVLIEMAKLCVCIGDVLFSQYSALGDTSSKADRDVTMMVTPTHSVEQARQLAKCDTELIEWSQGLSSSCRYKASGSSSIECLDEDKRIMRLHQAQLHMIYLTAVTVLHRPNALQSQSNGAVDRPTSKHSRSKVTEAATGISDIIYDLQTQDQLRYLSTSGIPAILWGAFGHLTDVSSARDGVHFSALGRFHQCLQALEELRDMYASADHAVWFLEAVIRKNNIVVPGLRIRRMTDPGSTSRGGKSMSQGHALASPITNGELLRGEYNTNSVTSPLNSYNASMPTSFTATTDYQPSDYHMDTGLATLYGNYMDIGDYWQQNLVDFDDNLDI